VSVRKVRVPCKQQNDKWKDVHCGFRALLAFVEDENRAGMPICEFEHCPNPECPKQHPTRIKRLYVMVKTNMATAQADFNDNALENQTSFPAVHQVHQVR